MQPRTILIAHAISAPQVSLRPIFPRSSRNPSQLISRYCDRRARPRVRSRKPHLQRGSCLLQRCCQKACRVTRKAREASELCTAGLSPSDRRRRCSIAILAPYEQPYACVLWTGGRCLLVGMPRWVVCASLQQHSPHVSGKRHVDYRINW